MSAWVAAEDAREARARLDAVQEFMRQAEDRLSRFRSDSELSRLNAQSGRPVRVSPLLWEVLVRALEWARLTSGLYDPGVLDALEAAGYDRTFSDVADSDAPAKPLPPRPGRWYDIRVDGADRSVLLPPGLRLDLGGIAKGWAADRAAGLLSALGPCLVDAGGDIAVRGAPPGRPGWPIGVADPLNPEADLALLMVHDRGVATSGTDYRRWRRGGAVQHHVIDPRTRRPAQTDLLAVTVVAPDATQADLHALVALVLGSEHGLRYLLARRDVEGLLVRQDGSQSATDGFGRYAFAAGNGAPRP